MKFPTLSRYPLQDRRVLVRVDFNVPLEGGEVSDDSRLVASLPTLKYLHQKGAKIILMSHLGRPKGKEDPKFSLKPIVKVLHKLLPKIEISFSEDVVGKKVEKKTHDLKPGNILVLENLRFYGGEEENDRVFAEQLSLLGDLYVNDAFSASHRAHASIDQITHFLPSCAGCLLEAELNHLEKFLVKPHKPLMAILGGAKISTKLGLIENLISKVDALLIGGAMVGTLLEAQGIFIGDSLSEPSLKKEAVAIIKTAKEKKCDLILSQDVVVETKDKAAPYRTTSIHEIQKGEMIADIGPQTIAKFKEKLIGAKTVVWNGPLGLVEVPPFDQGTTKIGEFLAHQKGMVTVCGGGDTVAILNKLGVGDKFSYVSMAGGAFLEWLEGRSLPGLVALEKAAH